MSKHISNKRKFINMYSVTFLIILLLSFFFISITAFNFGMPRILLSTLIVSILAFAPILIIIKIINYIRIKQSKEL